MIGYTAGVWDLFHVGHLRLLQRVRGMCDKMWSLKPGFVFLTVIKKSGNIRYKQHGGDNCIRMNTQCVEDKHNWADINILGKTYKGPAYVGRFLDDYYGRWWEEDLEWHWFNSPIYFNYQNLLKGKIC